MAEAVEQLDNELLKKTLKNLKILNFFMGFLAIITVISILIFGAVLFILVNFLQDMTERVDKFQQQTEATLDLRSQICSDPSASRVLGDSVCAAQQQ